MLPSSSVICSRVLAMTPRVSSATALLTSSSSSSSLFSSRSSSLLSRPFTSIVSTASATSIATSTATAQPSSSSARPSTSTFSNVVTHALTAQPLTRRTLHTASTASMSAPNAASAVGANNKWRILNTVLPEKKPVAYALTNIYGIGLAQALRICGDLGLNPTSKLHTLEHCFAQLRTYIEARFPAKHIAQKELGATILAKVKLGTYQGVRHTLCLPVHGQRTHTNAKTQRRLGRARAMLFNIPLKKKGAPQGSNRTPPKRPA